MDVLQIDIIHLKLVDYKVVENHILKNDNNLLASWLEDLQCRLFQWFSPSAGQEKATNGKEMNNNISLLLQHR